MEINGKIKEIFETKTFGEKGFRKREMVITTDEKYPQDILVEFIQDKCDLLDDFSPNDDVAIAINIRGKEYTKKDGNVGYFNSIQGWKIELSANENAPATPPPPIVDDGEDDGSLPF